MSYLDTRYLSTKCLSFESPVAEQIKVGDVVPMTFDTHPRMNGTWTVVKIEGNRIYFEREMKRVKSDWVKGLTKIEYKR